MLLELVLRKPESPLREMLFPRFLKFHDLRALAQLFEFRSVSRWVGLGLIVGVASGLSAALFYALIEVTQHVVLHGFAHFQPVAPRGERGLFDAAVVGPPRLWALVLAPAIGGLFSGIVIWRFSSDARAHGHDTLIRAFHEGTDIPGRNPLATGIAAAVVIGTGGSAGREGPIAYVGAGVSAIIGRALNLTMRERRMLLLAGAAGGVGAIFQSPLGAALFVMEVLYTDDFEVEAMVPTVLSSVIGYSVFTMIFGRGSIFVIHERYDFDPLQLPFYVVMSLGAAAVGLLYIRSFSFARKQFGRLPLHPALRPMIGGLAVGLLALVVPHALGAGYGWLQEALLPNTGVFPAGWMGAATLLGIALAKVLTTTLSISSGGAGGVFGPAVVIGGMTGGAFGLAFQQLVPSIVTRPGAFALVGMACFLGGVMKAPISTLVMASEMTGSYELLVPLMLTEVITYSLAKKFSLFESQLPTRRDSPAHAGEYVLDLLQEVRVEQVYDRDATVVPVEASMPVVELLRRASEVTHAVFPVIGTDGAIRGMVTLDSLRAAFLDEQLQRFAIAEDCSAPFISIAPRDTLGVALDRFAQSHSPELPVVDPAEPRRILGLLGYEDLLSAYSREMMRRRSE